MVLALLLRAQESPGNWVEILFVLLVLAGGMIKSIARAVKEGRKPGKPTTRSARADEPFGRPDEGRRPVGLDRWEALQRGEIPPVTAPPPPRRAPPAPSFEESLEGESLEGASLDEGLEPVPMLADFRSSGGEAAPSELTYLPSEAHLLPDEEAITRGASEESVPATTFDFGQIGETRRAISTAPRRARSPADWRAALVNAELLGPPLALRGPGSSVFGPRE